MVNTPLRISDVVALQGSLSWEESIALVQAIAVASTSGVAAQAPEATGTIAEDFLLYPDGTVRAAGDARRAVSVSELALFLGQLLPTETGKAERPPAGVKFTIARALGLVEAPPIPGVRQLTATLQRFERQERATVLATLYKRRTALPAAEATDRRQQRPSAAVFRRLLREADERAWDASRERVDDRTSATRVDVLRRFLREADERNYMLAAALRERTQRQHIPAGGLLARRRPLQTGLSVIALVAAAAVAEQYQSASRPSNTTPLRLPATSQRHGASTSLASPSLVPDTPRTPVVHNRATAQPTDSPNGRLTAARDTANLPTPTTGEQGLPSATDRRDDVVPERRADLFDSREQAGRMVEALDVNRKPVFSPSFSADGSAVFFDDGNGSSSAVMTAQRVQRDQAPVGGTRLRVVSLVDDGARNYHPHISPDNRTLAFDSDRDGERGVYLADRDGRHVRRVSGPGYAAVPTWSPDSRQLAFVKAEPGRPDVWNVWVLDVATDAAKRVTDYRYGQPWGASWFPDGRRICYAHEDRLVVLDLSNGRSQSYASPEPGRLVRTPAVSPNGRFVVFQLYRDGAWLLDLNDGTSRRILDDPTAEEFAWTPDGRRVAFHSKRSGDWGVWFMAPEP